MKENQKNIFVSVVIPVLNEQNNLKELFSRVSVVLKSINKTYEIIIVDDGSTDRSLEILKEIQSGEPPLRVVKLRRNYGQHPATFAGFQVALGTYVVTLDADMQNNPSDIPKLLDKIQEGYDVVSGKRVNRQDSFLRRKLPSRMINGFISRQTGMTQTDTGCFLKAYTLKAAREVAQFTEAGGFFTATFGILGFRYAEVEVSHFERQGGGVSRYNLFSQLNMFMSLFTGYARKPFQIIEMLGGLFVAVGIFFFFYLLFDKMYPWASVVHALVLIVGGLILGSVGVLGEFAVRIYYTVRNRPAYLIETVFEREES